MEIDRSVRVVKAKNATASNIVKTAHLQPPTGVAQPSPVTYHSTGINTQPPRNATEYETIHGRKPTFHELERNVGLAAIGRYTYAGEVKPHELVYGAPFPATQKAKSTYVDSGFRTISPSDCRKTLARAKVKASMMVNKYRHITEEAGIKIYAELHDDKVIHSEQFPTVVQLDAEGNSTGGSVHGLFLPNIYAEDIQPTPIATTNNISTRPESIAQDAAVSINPGLLEHVLPPRPIAALAPSLRPFDKPMLPIEDYGDEAPQYREDPNNASGDDDFEGRPATASERTDRVDPTEFVVYDAIKSRSRFAEPSVPSSRQSDKRKRREAISDNSSVYQSKRTKVSHLQEPRKEAQFDHPYKEPRFAIKTTNATADTNIHIQAFQLAVEPKSELRIIDGPRGPKADRVQHSETKRKDSRDDTRSRRRSRSPNREDVDNESASRNTYRERDSRERSQVRRRSKSADRQEISHTSVSESTSKERDYSSQKETAQGSLAEHTTQIQQQRSRRSDSGYETRTESSSSPTKDEEAARSFVGETQDSTSATEPGVATTQPELQQPVVEEKHNAQQVIKDQNTANNAVRAENAEQQQREASSSAEEAGNRMRAENFIPVPSQQVTQEEDTSNAVVRQPEAGKQEQGEAVAAEEKKRKERALRFQLQVQPTQASKAEGAYKEKRDEHSWLRKERDLERERRNAQEHSLAPEHSMHKQHVDRVENLAATTNDEMMRAQKEQDLQCEHHNAQKHTVQATRNTQKRSFDNIELPAPTNKGTQVHEEASTNKNKAAPRSRRLVRAAQGIYVPPIARGTRNKTTSSNHHNETGHRQTHPDIRDQGTDRGDERRKKRKY